MRIPGSLHFAAGCVLFVVLVAATVEGKRIAKKEEVLKEENAATQQKPNLFSFIKKLFPNPERTLESLKAVAATAKPKAKSMRLPTKGKTEVKDTKINKKQKTKYESLPIKKTGKPAAGVTTNRVRSSYKIRPKTKVTTTTTTTTPKPKKISAKKSKIHAKSAVAAKTLLKKKTGKHMRHRSDMESHNSRRAPPSADEMQILTHDQRRDRLRQELVKETEDNCLAKILCGGSSNQKPKNKNTFASDSAYLIREFFNIFDFTVDGKGEEKEKEINDLRNKKKTSDDQKSNDDTDDSDEEEDEEIFRQDQQSSKSKYTTNKPKRPVPEKQTSQQPVKKVHTTRTSKPMAFKEETTVFTKRPKPVTTTTQKATTVSTTTRATTTTITTTPAPKEDVYAAILDGGDMIPVTPSQLYRLKDRYGEAVTLASNNVLTNTMISTSVSGSATLKPLDLPFEIPLNNAKDDNNDDDEEDDDPKYTDVEDDGSLYHRVTLEELVGDIKLTQADMAMLRRGRSMKVNVNNVASDKYIQSKLRQLNSANNEVKKLRIAQKIGRSMREPRQCRQFSQIAQEVLQTCPLTTEVIRFFNTNLKNGTSLEVKRTPSAGNSTGGLVLLNNDVDGQQHTFFVDNSPIVPKVNYENDLKNPSVPSSFGKDEDQYQVYEKRPNPNPQNAYLNQHGEDVTKRRPNKVEEEKEDKDSEEERDDDGDSDEDEDEEDDQDDAEGRRVEEEEELDDDNEEDEDDYEDEEDYSRESEATKTVQGDHQQIQGLDTNQPNEKVVFRPQPPKRYTPPQPTLPPGIIRVYGVPQPSFDKDFSVLADQLGPRPAAIFGEEDIDRPEYKRRRQLPVDDDDDAEDVDENVAHGSRNPQYTPLESGAVNDGDDDDDDGDAEVTKKPYKQPKKKHSVNNRGKPLGGLKGADGDDDDDDDDDDDKKVGGKKKKVQAHSIESVDLNESPFSVSGFYNAANVPQTQPSPHQYDFFHHQPGTFQSHQHHHHAHHHPHSGYGYRPIVRPIQIIPDVQVPVPFRPTKSVMRPGRLYPLYNGKK